MDISNPEKREVRDEEVVKTKVRLVIRRGAKEDELEIPLFHPKMVKRDRRKWFTDKPE